MYRRDGSSELVRIVRGLQGQVSMRTEVIVRFEYGSVVPWVSQQQDGRLQFIAGPDRLLLDTAVQTRGEGFRTVGDFTVREGEEASFVLNWSPSFRAAPPPFSGEELAEACKQVNSFWTGWAAAFKPAEHWGDAVLRSLLTLKALAHWETGGIVAAGDDVLARTIGRPAQLGLSILLASGRDLHALRPDWRRLFSTRRRRGTSGSCARWPAARTICRFSTASPASDGSRNVNFLGCRAMKDSTPVRIGNGAVQQIQLDVYGEVLDAFYVARRAGLSTSEPTWALERALLSHLETIWRRPRRGHLGSARRPTPFHPFEGDGVGRVRPRGALNRGIRARRASRALARYPGLDSSGSLRARV